MARLTYKQAEHFALAAERAEDWIGAEEYWLRAADDTADAPAFLVARFRQCSVACYHAARVTQKDA